MTERSRAVSEQEVAACPVESGVGRSNQSVRIEPLRQTGLFHSHQALISISTGSCCTVCNFQDFLATTVAAAVTAYVCRAYLASRWRESV